MEIYTLTGSSGTGKSYRAMDICKEHNIDAVIDDGLFIYKGTIIAGESAKKSGTKIGAIKEAIFNDEQKAKKVARAIRHKNPKSILILGTSDAMADLIIERLELNMSKKGHRKVAKPVKRIYIEDITTEAERTEARKQRKSMGKHVIPAPAMQLKRSFAGYFLDTLGLFKGRAQATNERTVVRPSYSYIGDYVLSDKVINDICEITARKKKIISDVIMVTQEPSPENYVINIAVKIRPNCSLWDDVLDYQKAVNDMVEEMTAFNVSEVNVEVRGIDYGRNSYI